MFMASAPVDPNAPFLWTFGLVLPVERVRALCVELIAQWTRVVVVHKKERLAACEVVKGSKDRRMLVARWNDPHIELGCLQAHKITYS